MVLDCILGKEFHLMRKQRHGKLEYKNLRFLTRLLFNVFSAFLLLAFAISCAPEPVFDSVTEVKRGDVSVMVSAAGDLVFDRDQNLQFGISGEVSEILVKEGDVVTEGQVLARLQPESKELNLLKAQKRLKLAEEELSELLIRPDEYDLEIAALRIRDAENALEQAKVELERVQPSNEKLVEDALLSFEDLQETHSLLFRKFYGLEIATSELLQNPKEILRSVNNPQPLNTWTRLFPQDQQLAMDTIEGDLQSSWSDLREAELGYNRALTNRSKELNNAAKKVTTLTNELYSFRESLDELEAPPDSAKILMKEVSILDAKIALDKAEQELRGLVLHAPFNGTVMGVAITKGDTISANFNALRVVTPNSLHVLAYLDESDLVTVQEGQSVAITPLSNSHKTLYGVVTKSNAPYIMSSGRAMHPVEVSIQSDIDSLVRAGIRVSINIETEFKDNVIVGPVGALVRSGTRYAVDVVALDGITDKKLVDVGAMDKFNAEITRGLIEGQIVVNHDVAVGRSEFLIKERELRNNAN